MIALGVDGGASKTHAVLADDQGRVVGVGRAGCGNWEVVGLEGARATLHEAVGGALAQAGLRAAQVMASGYGLAGCDWPSDEGRLLPLIASLGLSGPVNLVNDAFLPLRAGTRDGVGIAAIAGSGTGVAGRNRAGQIARSFGAGYPFSDWGGAGEIAREAFFHVARQFKQLGPVTALTPALVAAFDCGSVEALLEGVMRWELKLSGRLAPLVFEVAHDGDAVARGIIAKAGRTMGENVVAVARRLEMLAEPFDLVTAGGVFSSRSPLLNDSLLQTVRAQAAGARLAPWDAAPVVGAVLLGLDLLHPERPLAPEAIAAQVSEALAALDA
jgi:N-acetylglucosamine kinase-like BadF-type ATPase